MRLIDADVLMADFQKAFPTFDVKSSHAKALLATAPTIKPTAATCFGCNCPKMARLEAEPTTHGRWIRTDAYPHRIYCSECYATFIRNDEFLHLEDIPHNYCPNCGARMDEVEE